MATTATRKSKPSLGAQIDKMWDIREKKRTLEASIKDLDGQLATIEAELMEDMEANGVDKMTGKHAGVSITSSTVAHVTDWDEMWKFILKTKNTQLLQRRVSDPAYRELLEMGKKVPGAEAFTKKRLNLRSL
jgi:hypothetical protein